MVTKDHFKVSFKKKTAPRFKNVGGIGAYRGGSLRLVSVSIHKDYDKLTQGKVVKARRKKLLK